MLNKLSFRIRNIILLCFTVLVVSYVQMFIHNQKDLWDTFGDFVVDYIISYFFVGIFYIISGVIIKITGKYFLPDQINSNTDIEDIMFYVSMVLIVLCILTFIWGYGFPFKIER